jgi:hypothetical protein
MPDELKHVKSIKGNPRPSDIFEPHLMDVELFEDMDELFREARRLASGEDDNEVTRSWKKFEGQRAIATITPGRLTMFSPSPEPNLIPEEVVAQEQLLMPPDPPLKISVISYTHVEALTTQIDKAIPFLGHLHGWAYLGHSVIVFEGHPSAFESGVRDCDVLFVDSGMLPFMQPSWIDTASRVMNEGARIFVHDRATHTLSQITVEPDAALLKVRSHTRYAEFLLRLLRGATRSSIEITSSTTVPDLAELIVDPSDREWLSKSFDIEHEMIDADSIIDDFLQRAGWRWYKPFKKTGVLRSPITTSQPPGNWNYNLTLRKDSAGRRQLVIER